MATVISSPQNSLIKTVINLQAKSKERRLQNIIIIEGRKEISLAVSAGILIEKILYCPAIISADEVRRLIGSQATSAEVYEVSKPVFTKISYRESTGGVIVMAHTPETSLERLKTGSQSVYIVLESVEKPGNLGAICRVADAAQVDGVIICDPLTDIYNPNAIRSSLGCVFTVPVVSSTFEETSAWLEKNDITSYAAELTASAEYDRVDIRGKAAFIFGTEATGLTEKWIKFADNRIIIPMRGVIDSLNVTTSVAVIIFEAMRQRNFGRQQVG